MKSKLSFISLIAVLVLFSSNLQAQTYGKIIPAKEANTLFGPVVDSVKINISKLDSIISGTKKNVMFFVKKSKLAIKGDRGKSLYNNGIVLDSTDVFNMFSISLLKKLLLQADSIKVKNVKVEKRSTVLSISTNDLTLEFGLGCPPYCE